MKYFFGIFLFSVSVALALKPSWSSIELFLKKKYPTVKGISVDSIKSVLSDTNLILIDVREKKEYEISHIPNAIWLKKVKHIEMKFPKKDTPLFIYCSVGIRSAKVVDVLQKKGYTKVFNVAGSIFAWYNKQYPVVDNNSDTTSQIHSYNKQWGKLIKFDSTIFIYPNY